jgi:hypothetical protein
VEPGALGLQQFERVVHPLHVANVRPERHAEKWHVECLSLAHHELNIDLPAQTKLDPEAAETTARSWKG